MKIRFRYILMAVTLCVCSASLALGASVTIVPTPVAGSFDVQGANMDGVAGIVLTIGYDTSTLGKPSVKWGSLVSGAMTVPNTTVPGTIKMSIARVEPFSGSGPIATVSFAIHNGSGVIPSLFVNQMTDSNGENVSAQAGTATAGSGLSTTAGLPFSSSTAAATPPVMTGLGTVTMPGDNQPKSEVKPAESAAAHPPETSEAAESTTQPLKQPTEEKTAEAIEPVEVKQTVYGGVLDRFRAYRGEKTPSIMVALFTKAVSPSIRQVPAVVISDGKATVRVIVDLSAIKGTSTSFALSNAKLVSLKKDDESNTWVLDALPKVNSLKATVTILNSSSVIEFPLTVVPPAASVSAKQADFAAFLKDSGAKVPKHDLNGDGLHDYLDDYIYTAHYLINSSAAAKHAK